VERKKQTNRRRWWVAGLFSYLVPGLGQVYNGQATKGLFFNFLFTTWGGVVFAFTVQALKRAPSPGSALLLTVLFFVTLAAQLCIAVEAIRGSLRARDGFAPMKYNRPSVYGAVLAVCLAVQFSISGTVREYILKPFHIPTGSMSPALEPGDFLLSNQLYFADRNPDRGDVVIHESVDHPGIFMIKRIVGLPGDTLEVRGREVLIDGRPLDEPYAKHDDPAPAFSGSADQSRGSWILGDEEYFLLGDNRDHSMDSRQYGPVPRHSIKGRPMFIYFSGEGLFKWRIGRIGKIIR
jgi:signal peptidase I